MKLQDRLQQVQINHAEDGIIVPALLWWMGVPLVVVVILWLVF